MSFISYAQNYEDVMLWRALQHIENGFYIDVGAAWPDVDSVTKAFYDKGWRGINIEPNPTHYASLLAQRPNDINLKLAIGAQSGQMTMNFIGSTGLSTLDANIANVHKTGGWSVEQQQVDVQPLWALCQEHVPAGQAIHFMKVDVEGFEQLALQSNDWKRFRPWIVVVEATLPLSQTESYEGWEPILVDAAYRFAYADGLNRFYVAIEHAQLLAVFKYPPNFFDGFLLHLQLALEAKAEHAQAQAQQHQAQAQQAQAQAQQAQAQAQQAKAQAQQAQAQVQQAQAQVQQAKVQQAQAQAQAQQAQALAHHHATELHAVYSSTSWRITAPLRWPVFQWRLLRQQGLQARLIALMKKTLITLLHFVGTHPRLHDRLQRLSAALGLDSRFKRIVKSLMQAERSSHADVANNAPVLSARARHMHAEIQTALLHTKEGGA